MSIWSDYGFEEAWNNSNVSGLVKSFSKVSQEVTEEMETFVGTRAEYEEEFNNRVAEFRALQKEAQLTLNAEKGKIIAAWKEAVRDDYGINKDIFDVIYDIAYEQGHALGFSNVESYFDDLAEPFLKVYRMGLTAGREGL